MRFFHAAPMALLLALLPGEATAEECAADVDGCSIPFDLDFFFKSLFTASCHRHDVCYSCGLAYGIDRETCDDAFLDNMEETCENARRRRSLDKRNILDRLKEKMLEAQCKRIAYGYYAVVRMAGSSRYDDPSKRFCNEAYVQRCLP